ncbi:uncharacterized protein LY79DRAFT_582916 [Colletotrichum navitas]|uniref:Uncharacterized protein n=1 Tax=Colletotrichum navitas TaxID=681940 RepID=A0AAD8PRU2_9PEZI|nr:uncharacterized protein LY79DRAFT_582916 [Colletotrichum navitas]KAK1574538.1 hypothetical protein LY79DRAFT_582916 [Colletotrichum navitas]
MGMRLVSQRVEISERVAQGFQSRCHTTACLVKLHKTRAYYVLKVYGGYQKLFLRFHVGFPAGSVHQSSLRTFSSRPSHTLAEGPKGPCCSGAITDAPFRTMTSALGTASKNNTSEHFKVQSLTETNRNRMVEPSLFGVDGLTAVGQLTRQSNVEQTMVDDGAG